MQTMESRGTSRTRGESGKSQISEVTTDSVALGDVICIKLRGGSWWPAQVVDDNSVNESIKPGERSAGEVLVRLYGSYTYFYADPIKCRSEFEMILKHNNGSYRKILQQALEQDLPRTKSCRSKGSASKTKVTEKKMKRNQDKTRENVKKRIPSTKKEVKRKSYKQDEEQKDLMVEKKRPRSKPIEEQNKVESRKQNEMLNDDDLSSQSPEITSIRKSQELSARRIRVMKSLGLIAPPGSPFHRDGHIYDQSS